MDRGWDIGANYFSARNEERFNANNAEDEAQRSLWIADELMAFPPVKQSG
jgi:hypothetical protein